MLYVTDRARLRTAHSPLARIGGSSGWTVESGAIYGTHGRVSGVRAWPNARCQTQTVAKHPPFPSDGAEDDQSSLEANVLRVSRHEKRRMIARWLPGTRLPQHRVALSLPCSGSARWSWVRLGHMLQRRRGDSSGALRRAVHKESIMTRACCITVLATLALWSFPGEAAKDGKVWWPQFRGPNSSGLGDGKPPVQFGPGQDVLWKTPVGAGLSSPIVWEGRVFLTEFDRATRQLATLSIDRRTGKILWRRTIAPQQIEKVHELSSPAGATPVTDGERVYVYFGSYGLVSYDLNGTPKWERPLPMPENPYGAVASPIVAGDLLVLNHQGKDAYLLAVNRRDGRTVWKTDRSKFQYGWSTPVHWRHDGIDEIIVLGGDFKPDQRLMAYNLADGAERWWVGGLPPCGKSTPVVGGGLLFFAAPDIIMEPAAERRSPERAAQLYANNAARVVAVRPGGKGEVSETNIAWSERKGVPGVPSPLYYNGRLYTFQNGGIVYCRLATTGELLYMGRLGAPGYYYSSPVAADDKIYIASADGVVVVLDAGEALKILATNTLDGGILATPALIDGNIYVRTDSHLYAFGR
jgi:outer membrane protein assembly factor BamB